jgi:hypothetical protein
VRSCRGLLESLTATMANCSLSCIIVVRVGYNWEDTEALYLSDKQRQLGAEMAARMWIDWETASGSVKC